MKTITITRLFSIVALFAIMASSTIMFSQEDENIKKAHIRIQKNIDGKSTMIDTTIEISNGTDIDVILEQLGVKDHMEGFDTDENVKIIIEKSKKGENIEDYSFFMEPNTFTIDKNTAFMGVYIELHKTIDGDDNTTQTEEGAYVTGIVDGSGAEAAGMQSGGFITAVDDMAVTNYDDLVKVLKTHKPGDVVYVSYRRDGATDKVEITLTPKIEKTQHSFHFKDFGFDHDEFAQKIEKLHGKKKVMLGVGISEVTETDDTDKESGVYVTKVFEGSAAEQMKLQDGDKITGIDGKSINDLDGLREGIAAHKAGETINVTYVRDGQTMNGSAELKEQEVKMDFRKMKMPHFKFEGEDMEKVMEELKKELQNIDDPELREKIQQKLEDAFKNKESGAFWHEKMNEMHGNDNQFHSIHTIEIRIEMDEVTDEEASNLKINNNNDLEFTDLRFAPNPSDGKFTFSINLPEEGKTHIRIFDIQGKEVYSEILNDFSGEYNSEVDISDQADGVYFLNVEQNGKSISRKMVIQ